MAPSKDTKISRGAKAPNGHAIKQQLQQKIQLMQKQKENEENQAMIIKLTEALKQKDEALEALTAEDLREMDIDMEDYNPWDEGREGGETTEKKDERNVDGGVVQSIESDENEKEPKKNKGKNVVLPNGNNGGDENGLFNAESDSDSDADPIPVVDPELGKALYSFRRSGDIEGTKTVAWASRGRVISYINMYGKKSAARHRLTKSAYPQSYEDKPPEEEHASNPINRLGDVKKGNGRPMHTTIDAIFAVAWKIKGFRPSQRDLDMIDPALVKSWRTVPTYVLIRWDINGEKKKCWEPRSTLRDRWGRDEADDAIYKAAKEAEERYYEAKTGRRRAYSRSPSQGLVRDYVQQFEDSLGFSRSSQSPSKSTRRSMSRSSPSPVKPTRRSKSRSPPPVPDIKQLMEEFLENWCELAGVHEFGDLDRDEKRDCIAAWKDEKAELVLAA